MIKSIFLTAMFLATKGEFAQNEVNLINQNAPVKCRKTITINADRKAIWKVLTDINNWASWQADISKSKMNGELKPESTFNWKSGGVKIQSTLKTVVEHRNLGWTGKSFGILAIHNWEFSDQDGKTIVSVEESMEGFLAGLFKKSLNKKLEEGMQTWLDLLKLECEK